MSARMLIAYPLPNKVMAKCKICGYMVKIQSADSEPLKDYQLPSECPCCGWQMERGEGMTTEEEKWREIGESIVKGFNDGIQERRRIMTEERAKGIIINDPHGNILERMMAIAVAKDVLGEDCTMEDIWRWAEERGD